MFKFKEFHLLNFIVGKKICYICKQNYVNLLNRKVRCKSILLQLRRKQNKRKVYKNSRQPVAYVVGKDAQDMVPPRGCLAHCNQAMPDRSDGCTASESPWEACESQQRRSDRRRLCRNSKSCSEKNAETTMNRHIL